MMNVVRQADPVDLVGLFYSLIVESNNYDCEFFRSAVCFCKEGVMGQ